MATATQRPNSNINSLWATNAYTNIDEVVNDPSAGDGLLCDADGADDNEEQQWGVQDDGLTAITQTVVHFLADDDNNVTVTIKVKADGAWSSGQTQAITTGGGGSSMAWYSKTFALSSVGTVEAVSILTPSMTVSEGVFVDTVYLVTTGTTPAAGTTGAALLLLLLSWLALAAARLHETTTSAFAAACGAARGIWRAATCWATRRSAIQHSAIPVRASDSPARRWAGSMQSRAIWLKNSRRKQVTRVTSSTPIRGNGSKLGDARC